MSKWFKKEVKKITDPVASEPAEKTRVSKSITENTICLKSRFGNSFDILYKEISLKGNKALFVMDDGMCNNMQVIWQVIGPVLFAPNMPNEPSRQADYIRDRITTGADQSQTYDLDEAITDVLSGLIVLFIDGVDFCLEFGVQGFPKRSVDDAKTEVQERGSHEGFTESFKDNAALLRRRVRSPIMKCETLTVGTTSKTRICVCYMSDRASQETVDNIKARLKKAKLDMVLGSGYIAPFLDTQSTSFFSGVGTTERPDVACAEMAEGRVVLLVDGTPFALIVPYLFVENFQSMDDYNYRPYYAVFIRTLKFISFLISAASMSSLLQPATPAAIAAAASTTNVLLLIMMRSFVHVDFSGGTAALRQYIGSWRKRLSCKGNRKATHWNKLQAVVGRGRRRSGPQRAIAARIAASCSSYGTL